MCRQTSMQTDRRMFGYCTCTQHVEQENVHCNFRNNFCCWCCWLHLTFQILDRGICRCCDLQAHFVTMVSVRTWLFSSLFQRFSDEEKILGKKLTWTLTHTPNNKLRIIPGRLSHHFFLLIIISYYAQFQRNGGRTDIWTDRHTDVWTVDFNIFGSCRHFGVISIFKWFILLK